MKPLIPLKRSNSTVFYCARAPSTLPFCQKHKPSFRRPMAAIPGSTQRRGKTPFLPHHRRSEHSSWLVFAL